MKQNWNRNIKHLFSRTNKAIDIYLMSDIGWDWGFLRADVVNSDDFWFQSLKSQKSEKDFKIDSSSRNQTFLKIFKLALIF